MYHRNHYWKFWIQILKLIRLDAVTAPSWIYIWGYCFIWYRTLVVQIISNWTLLCGQCKTDKLNFKPLIWLYMIMSVIIVRLLLNWQIFNTHIITVKYQICQEMVTIYVLNYFFKLILIWLFDHSAEI